MRDLAEIPTLETARLLLRPPERADADQIQSLFSHWEIVRYLPSRVPWPYPPDGARQNMDSTLAAIAAGQEWHWTLRLKSRPGQLVGRVNLKTRENHNRGFWVGLPWQGRGLASEAADAVTDFWFHTLRFPVLRVSKAAPNLASRRISEKHGMRLVATEECDYVCGRLPSEIWEITAEEWDARRQAK